MKPALRIRSRSRCIETKKRCFELLADAIAAATIREKAAGVPLYTYVCPFCEKFHMTKIEAKRRLFVDKARGKPP
jgi:hypothetical protein